VKKVKEDKFGIPKALMMHLSLWSGAGLMAFIGRYL